MSGWIIYLITRLDTITISLRIVALASAMIVVIFGFPMSGIVDGIPSEMTNICRKILKWLIIICISSFTLNLIVPTQTEGWLIFGLPKIIYSETIQKDLADVYNRVIRIMNKKLDKIEENLDGKGIHETGDSEDN